MAVLWNTASATYSKKVLDSVIREILHSIFTKLPIPTKVVRVTKMF
jgi:hypothetical protein